MANWRSSERTNLPLNVTQLPTDITIPCSAKQLPRTPWSQATQFGQPQLHHPAGQPQPSPLQHTISAVTQPASNPQHHFTILYATSSFGQWETYPIQYSNILHTQPSTISISSAPLQLRLQPPAAFHSTLHREYRPRGEGVTCCNWEQEEKKSLSRKFPVLSASWGRKPGDHRVRTFDLHPSLF